MKTFTVRFCWMTPIVATYDVQVPEGATTEQIIEAANEAGDMDAWEAQKPCHDASGATFVDAIREAGGPARHIDHDPAFKIPEDWGEAKCTGRLKGDKAIAALAHLLDRWRNTDVNSACDLLDEICELADAAGIEPAELEEDDEDDA